MRPLHRAALFVGLLCASAGSVHLSAAVLPCPLVPTPLSAYLLSGFACTETDAQSSGLFTFKSFFAQSPQIAQQNLITVTAIPGDHVIGLQFSGFTAMLGQPATYLLNYFIDPPPPIIIGEQIDLDPAMLVTVLCGINSPNPFLCPAANTLGTLTVSSLNPSATIFIPARNTLGVMNTLTVTPNPLTGTETANFDNKTLLQPAAIPEPGAALLMASGLVGLCAFRVRAKLRQVLLEFRS